MILPLYAYNLFGLTGLHQARRPVSAPQSTARSPAPQPHKAALQPFQSAALPIEQTGQGLEEELQTVPSAFPLL